MADIPIGRFIWHECLTGDLDVTIDYYTKLVGWGSSVWDGETGPYHMLTRGETPVGGVMVLPEEARMAGAPPTWMTYISTPNTDATMEKVKEFGGDVLVPGMTIPGIGRMAVLCDPHSAVFACYTPNDTPAGADNPPQVGDFSWHELMTDDWEAAFDFYSALFEWEKKDAMEIDGVGTYQMFGVFGSDRPLGGMYNKPAEVPMSSWMPFAMVGSVDDAVEQMKTLGGNVLNGPMDVPGGDRVVYCSDSQGAVFAMHSTAG